MNCIEVNELIQRQLDTDLSDNEEQQLNQHIDECLECKSFYQRLRRVHIDLESLPKVSLPFSIVDLILPEIDRMDHSRVEPVAAKQLNHKWKLNNKRVSGLAAVAAGVVIIFSLTQFFEQRNMNNVAGEQENQTMQISGYANVDTAHADLPKEKMMTRESVAEDVQSSKTSEVALTSDQTGAELSDKVNTAPPQKAFSNQTITQDIESTSLQSQEEDISQSQNEFGMAMENNTDRGGMVTPTYTIANTEHKMIPLESPDHTFIALYNEMRIEIKNANNDALMEITTESLENISELEWISDSELQYSIQNGAKKQIWIINASTGEKNIKQK